MNHYQPSGTCLLQTKSPGFWCFNNESNYLTYECQVRTLWPLTQQISLTLKIRHNIYCLVWSEELCNICKGGIGSFIKEWKTVCSMLRAILAVQEGKEYILSSVLPICLIYTFQSIYKYEKSITEWRCQELGP